VFNEFIYENQFETKINTQIKFKIIKIIIYNVAHIKNIIKNKYLIYIKYTKKTYEKIKHT
jgi:hypothetical protein